MWAVFSQNRAVQLSNMFQLLIWTYIVYKNSVRVVQHVQLYYVGINTNIYSNSSIIGYRCLDDYICEYSPTCVKQFECDCIHVYMGCLSLRRHKLHQHADVEVK